MIYSMYLCPLFSVSKPYHTGVPMKNFMYRTKENSHTWNGRESGAKLMSSTIICLAQLKKKVLECTLLIILCVNYILTLNYAITKLSDQGKTFVEFFNPKIRRELEKKDEEFKKKTGYKGAAPDGDEWVWLTSYCRIPVCRLRHHHKYIFK